MRTEEQIEAISELNDREVQNLRKFHALVEDAVGADATEKLFSCVTNGWDTCKDLGITHQNGFTDSEIQNAADRFTVNTALLNELI